MRQRKLLVFLSLILVSFIALAGCKNVNPVVEENDNIVLNKQSIEMVLYEDFLLTVYDEENNAIVNYVEWSTVNAAIATVGEDGTVIARGVGETLIKATYQEAEATCTVIVNSNQAVPVISVDITEIDIFEKGSYQLVPTLTYQAKLFTDVIYSYSVTSGSDYISVSNEGVISATALGQGEVTIVASWRGVPSEQLTITLNVNVKLNATIIAENQNYSMFSADPENAGLKIADTIFVDVVKDGEELLNPEILWSFYFDTDTETNYDNGVISLNNGVITSLKPGESKVIATYTFEGYTISTDPINIIIEKTVVDKTGIITKDIDTDGVSTFNWNDYDFFEGQTITKIVDKQSDNELTFTLDESSLIITKDANLIIGERVWQIHNESYAYEISAIVCSKIINTNAELLAMQTSYGNNASADNNYLYNGYFILGDNITFEEGTTFGAGHIIFTSFKHFDANKPNYNAVGFQGTFDGRGYSVSGITFYQGGLFGNIGGDAVVKNLGFNNVKFTKRETGDLVSHILSFGIFGTVENISLNIVNDNLNVNPSGTLAQVLSGNAVVSNVIATVESVNTTGYGGLLNWYRIDNNGQKPQIVNCYVISSLTGITGLASPATMPETGVEITIIKPENLDISLFKDFDEDIWSLSGNKPIFNNSISNVELKFNGSYVLNLAQYEDSAKISDNLKVDVYYNDLLQSNPTILYSFYFDTLNEIDYNNGVVTLTNNTIVALKAGTTKVVGSFTIGGKIYKTAPIEITIIDYMDKTLTISKDIDTYIEGEGTTITWSDTSGIFESAQTITSIKDKATGNLITFSYDGDVLLITKDENLIVGERIWQVSNENFMSEISVTVITKIIRTGEELLAMQTSYGNSPTLENFYLYNGYFILGNNITFEEGTTFGALHVRFTSYKHFNAYKPGYNIGFQGVFDGRGYAISGLTLNEGGLFGNIGGDGVVENLALNNVKFTKTTDDLNSHILGFGIFGTVNNLSLNINNDNLNANPSATLAQVLSGDGVVSNVIVTIESVNIDGYGAIINWYRPDGVQIPQIINCYVISSIVDIKGIASPIDMPATGVEITIIKPEDLDISLFTNFDENIWNLSDSKPELIIK